MSARNSRTGKARRRAERGVHDHTIIEMPAVPAGMDRKTRRMRQYRPKMYASSVGLRGGE